MPSFRINPKQLRFYISINKNISGSFTFKALKPEYAVVTNTRSAANTAINRVKKSNKNFKKVYYTPEGTVTLMINSSGEITFYQ